MIVLRQLNHYALDHRDFFIAGQRILQRGQRGVPDGHVGQVHLACPALILLEGCDALRVRGPDENGIVRVGPPGVVRCIAEVGDAVEGKLQLFSGGDVARPQVPVADECGPGSIGRKLYGLTVAWAARLRHRLGSRSLHRPAYATAGEIAGNVLPCSAEDDRCIALRQGKGFDGQVIAVKRDRAPQHRVHRSRELHLVEGWSLRLLHRVYEHVGHALCAGVAIPQAPIRQPLWVFDRMQHQRLDVIGHPLFSARVVVRGVHAAGRGLRERRRWGSDQRGR